MSEGIDGLGPAMIDTSADADVLVLSLATTVLGCRIAEGMGIPSVGAYLQPMAPTGDFPPVAFGTRSLGRWANRRTADLTGLGDRIYLSHINVVRGRLGLPPTTIRAYRRDRVRRWPILDGFSEYVLPRPSAHPNSRREEPRITVSNHPVPQPVPRDPRVAEPERGGGRGCVHSAR